MTSYTFKCPVCHRITERSDTLSKLPGMVVCPCCQVEMINIGRSNYNKINLEKKKGKVFKGRVI